MVKKVLFAASEALPFASTGGLGDVIGSLPAAMVKNGIDARAVIPLYGSINQKYRDEMEFVCAIRVRLSWRNQYCGIYTLVHNGVRFYFIDNEYYFKRASMYGSYDDGERYAFYCKAVLDMLPYIGFFPDVLHSNDWQTALTAVYLKHNYSHMEKYRSVKSVHTIHNIEYQGVYDFKILSDVFDLAPGTAQTMDYDGALNLTKGAIVCCDRLTTVSPRYSQEIHTPDYSSGLHHIINLYSSKISGIINGIDIDYYNSETDSLIAENFTSDDISGKAACKNELQRLLKLPERADVPLVAMITRLASHKGIDLVTAVIEEFMHENVQFVILGTGSLNYENFFKQLESNFNDRARAVIAYDKDLSKKIYAGADMFLMPSKSEPCGLAQMIASRYGTVPLVRETGGLYDTIKNNENGYTFVNYNAHEMLFKLKEACGIYSDNRKAWNELVKRTMNVDFSWNVSANNYIELYNDI